MVFFMQSRLKLFWMNDIIRKMAYFPSDTKCHKKETFNAKSHHHQLCLDLDYLENCLAYNIS